MTVAIEFRREDAAAEPGSVLLQGMRDEIAEIYDGQDLDAPDMPKAGPAELGPPDGAFLVGYLGGEAVCCGGVKRLSGEACEIKRMYVDPAHRGRGIARALLVALEDTARELGYAVARLDTGPRQPQAQAMYERAGYRPIGNFNANPVASFWGEKPLT